MTKFYFGSVEEEVVSKNEFSLSKSKKILAEEKIVILGYGIQGSAQALNLKDNGLKVIIGQRKGTPSWDQALSDGFKEKEDLLDIEDALHEGTFISYLLSDAGQIQQWPVVLGCLTKGKTLCFAHGFSITYQEQTNIIPPPHIDVVLVAPKGSGKTLREKYLKKKGLNASVGVHQDFSGRALDKARAMAIAIGSPYLFDTTFERETHADLVGERGVLVGAIQGLFAAQYDLLRKKGYTPLEAYNETVDEALESLYPLIAQKGMDWMFTNCSTTAQRGALDWWKKFRDALAPVFEELYDSVVSGQEVRNVLKTNAKENYRATLDEELGEIINSELWKTGKIVRKFK